MKKQMKKLVLSRETLVSLEHNLGKVAGGGTQQCTDSGAFTCPGTDACGTRSCLC